MRICLQLLQNYLKQQIPTIILTIDKEKYIFNMPTCFQRFIKDHKQKFPKGSNIFFTKASTDTLAGLSGFMLTIFQSGYSIDSKLFLSDEIYKYFEEMRYKMGFKILPYSYSNLFSKQTRTGLRSTETIFELVKREDYPQIFVESEKYIHQNFAPKDRNQSRKLLNQDNEYYDGNLKIIPFQIVSNGQKITNFICIPNKLQGKVIKEKLKQYKIPNAQISKLLSQGSLIVDGNQVKAEQVKQPDSPSPNFLILHYNSIQSINLIINNDKFVTYVKNPNNFTNSIVHIVQNSEAKILQSQGFAQMLKIFPAEVNHLVYNNNYRNENDYKLKPIIPKHLQLVSYVNKFFPNAMPNILDQHHSYMNEHYSKSQILQKMFVENRMLAYKRCHQLVLAPKKSQGYFPMQQQKQKEKKQYNEPQNVLGPEQIKIYEPDGYNFKDFDPKVVFLGTGSMKPSKYRNVSSIFVQLSEKDSLMLDCGQGSYYQLFNHYGQERIDDLLLTLRVIFITHIHSDHNLGILDTIAERNKLLRKKYKGDQEEMKKNKLFLMIPYNVLPWFHSYVSQIQNLLQGCEILFIQTILKQQLTLTEATISKDERLQKSCNDMIDEKQQDMMKAEERGLKLQAYFVKHKVYFQSPYMKMLYETFEPLQAQTEADFTHYLNSIGINEFVPVHVDHCPQSYAIVIGHKSKVKISYSGDCRPSEQFAKTALNSTLMIHQATFGDDLQGNAEQNMHSTVGEALDIGMKSNSWKTALTHFSQRYVSSKEIVNPSMYKLNKQKCEYAQNHTIVCFDHLRMRMSELPLLAYQSKKISEIFPSDTQQ